MHWTFIATEVLAYVFAAAFIWHAWRHGMLPVLIAATLFGFILEYLAVKTVSDYCYGEFMVMLPPMSWPVTPDWCPVGPRVPLWGTLTWGFLMYGAMTTSSFLAVPWLVRPLFDGLIVLTIDWTLDPLATQLRFWIWDKPGEWYGIPLDNYAGWFILVASFSLVMRVAREHVPRFVTGWIANVVVVVVTPPVSMLLLTVSLEIFEALAARGVSQPLMLAAILGPATLVVAYHAVRSPGDTKPQWLIVGVALASHMFYFALILYSGLYLVYPSIVVVSVVMFVVTLVGYGWPYRHWLKAHL